LPNLRYLLDPNNTEPYREEFIRQLADISDIYINCAFGCSHRVTKSIKMLPQLMRQQGKLVVAGDLLYEEVTKLSKFAHKILTNPQKSIVVAGGAKISDKISILKEFVISRVKGIFIGGKMVNCFLLASQHKEQMSPFGMKNIPQMLLKKNAEDNQNLIREVQLAEEIIELAEKNNVQLILPDDYKVVDDYSALNFEIKTTPDFNKELQLDLGPKTIENFSQSILFQGEVENVFWNGPLGAYDHPANNAFLEGSLELAKILFREALIRENFSVVIGGGDSAAILNKVSVNELKKLIKRQIEKTLLKTVNRDLLTIGFTEDDSYILWNYFASNFFVSTGGGAALEFMEEYLRDKGQKTAACYLAGTAALMEGVSS
jgi:phosphoglycerate kinase